MQLQRHVITARVDVHFIQNHFAHKHRRLRTTRSPQSGQPLQSVIVPQQENCESGTDSHSRAHRAGGGRQGPQGRLNIMSERQQQPKCGCMKAGSGDKDLWAQILFY